MQSGVPALQPASGVPDGWVSSHTSPAHAQTLRSPQFTGAQGLVQVPPGSLQTSVVHTSPSEQFFAGPEQVPEPLQVSGVVQPKPSLQAVPEAA